MTRSNYTFRIYKSSTTLSMPDEFPQNIKHTDNKEETDALLENVNLTNNQDNKRQYSLL